MKALYYRGSSVGGQEWREQQPPEIVAPSDALVRPIATTTCDLDHAILHSSLPGEEQPFAIGHEAVGEVTEVGRGVTRLRPGDTVVIPYHLSCGACDRCTEQLPLCCRETAAEALPVFGMPVAADYGGLFSELTAMHFC
jgi:alcohol dehydrogenase